jgi:hypothetical protein
MPFVAFFDATAIFDAVAHKSSRKITSRSETLPASKIAKASKNDAI